MRPSQLYLTSADSWTLADWRTWLFDKDPDLWAPRWKRWGTLLRYARWLYTQHCARPDSVHYGTLRDVVQVVDRGRRGAWQVYEMSGQFSYAMLRQARDQGASYDIVATARVHGEHKTVEELGA